MPKRSVSTSETSYAASTASTVATITQSKLVIANQPTPIYAPKKYRKINKFHFKKQFPSILPIPFSSFTITPDEQNKIKTSLVSYVPQSSLTIPPDEESEPKTTTSMSSVRSGSFNKIPVDGSNPRTGLVRYISSVPLSSFFNTPVKETKPRTSMISSASSIPVDYFTTKSVEECRPKASMVPSISPILSGSFSTITDDDSNPRTSVVTSISSIPLSSFTTKSFEESRLKTTMVTSVSSLPLSSITVKPVEKSRLKSDVVTAALSVPLSSFTMKPVKESRRTTTIATSVPSPPLSSFTVKQVEKSSKSDSVTSTSSLPCTCFTTKPVEKSGPKTNLVASASSVPLSSITEKPVAENKPQTNVVTSVTSVPFTLLTVKPVEESEPETSSDNLTQLKNNLILSPIEGGFKFPLSPLKNPFKVSIIPVSSSRASEGNGVAFSVESNQVQSSSTTNFQFQTLVTPKKRKVNDTNFSHQQQQVSGCKVRDFDSVSFDNGTEKSTLSAGSGAVANPCLPQPNEDARTSLRMSSVKQPVPIQPPLNVQSLQKPLETPHVIAPASTSQSTQVYNFGNTAIPTMKMEQPSQQFVKEAIVNFETYNSRISDSSSWGNQNVTMLSINEKVHKSCNCSRSKCLKLYCECFANGKFCVECNCVDCHNNLNFEAKRSKAIKSCLERNPNAFRPKIGRGNDDNRTHQKGCHCKKSGCLKKYCECYEARIPCTSKCKCTSCKNIEGNLETFNKQRSFMNVAARQGISSHFGPLIRPKKKNIRSFNGGRLPSTFFTKEVIEAACTCMLTQAEEAEKSKSPAQAAERMVLQEFGRCVMQIIQAAGKTKV